MNKEPHMNTKLLVAILAVLGLGGPAAAGVLIGESPREVADVHDLRWTISGDRVTLVVVGVGSDGKTREITHGPHPKSLVRQALRYAADGRPLTVTMINTPPLPDQKVLLHPALLDTPEGQQAIRLDLLIRRYAKQQWDEAAQRAYRHHALYQWAWAVRYRECHKIYLAARSSSPPESKEDREAGAYFEALFEHRLGQARAILENPDIRKRASEALEKVGQATDSRSLLRRKSEFYDPVLVDLIAKARVADGLDAVTRAVATRQEELASRFAKARDESGRLTKEREALDAEAKALNRISKELDAEEANQVLGASAEFRERVADYNKRVGAYRQRSEELRESGQHFLDNSKDLDRVLLAGLSQLPEITIPSGVRELGFKGTLEDYAPAADGSPLPFRFLIQVIFETAPAFLEDGKKAEDYVDSRPYELTDLALALESAVVEGLRRDADAAETVRVMAAFTRLQRLFRAGIDDKLGARFPVSRLEELAEAIGGDDGSGTVRTLRWSPFPGGVEKIGQAALAQALAAVEKEDSDEAHQVVVVLTKCRSLLAERAALRRETETTLDGLDALASGVASTALVSPLAGNTVAGLAQEARSAVQDGYARRLDGWMVRWDQVVRGGGKPPKTSPLLDRVSGALADLTSLLKGGGEPAKGSSGVARANRILAHLTYMLQIRHGMRVLDDEYLAREDRLWHPEVEGRGNSSSR
jgi:hypothetical protein